MAKQKKIKLILNITILFIWACSLFGSTNTIEPTQPENEVSPSGNSPLNSQPTELEDNANTEPLPTSIGPLREIPGITKSYVWDMLETRGFTCEDVEGSETLLFSECTKDDPEFSYKVSISIRKANFKGNGSPIEHLKSSVTDIRKQPEDYRIDTSEEAVVSFLGFMATLPYDNAEPDMAKQWVENTLHNYSKYIDRSKNFAGVIYLITTYPRTVYLEMGRL